MVGSGQYDIAPKPTNCLLNAAVIRGNPDFVHKSCSLRPFIYMLDHGFAENWSEGFSGKSR
jgi:hypothetical protein